MNKKTVFVMQMRAAISGEHYYIVRDKLEDIEHFKKDADKDGRFVTSDIQQATAESITVDNTIYAINCYDTTGSRVTTQAPVTFEYFLVKYYFNWSERSQKFIKFMEHHSKYYDKVKA